ncbi:PEPxxWA-CTERM sorting domain-containing protein [Phenylobacterium sp.]|uniref:PEPxxWA-CTERM sorting domain-containing protein n=1 Tax=Phenylobacterium sp. TaxID=1871053 RepID=UPI0025F4E41D|nr:PEPxxWA-CTERM sorting domain-containing protein [Phenylobacterium sp.]
MRHTLKLAASALALAFGASPAFAAAVINFPPPGSHSFIALYEIDSGLASCPQVQCAIVSDPSVATTMAPMTFHDSTGLNFITASGSTGPDAIHASVSGFSAAEFDLAFSDTYTVHGGTGPFAITTTLQVDGFATSIPFGAKNAVFGANMVGTIGTLDIDPHTLLPIVNPFDFTTKVHSAVVSQLSAAPVSVPLGLTVSYTRTVNPGDVFDIAYELSALFSVGGIDASHTARIGFDTPDDVFLTAASGATFGHVPPPPSGVPEPASWALMIVGFGAAGAALRRRRALIAPTA